MRVRTPDGREFEESSPTALAYYRREPGYEVLTDELADVPVVASVEADAGESVPGSVPVPHKNAAKPDWYEYARDAGLAVPEDLDDITKDELIALVEKATVGS